MGKFQRRYEGEEDEAASTIGTCAERAVIDHGASAKWTARRGFVVLRALAALTGIRGVAAQTVRGVAAQTALETPRDLCIQGIQTAIIDRIDDLFEDIYLPNRHQRPHVLYQLAEHPNFGDTFIDRGEEKLLARLGLEPAAECSTAKASGTMMQTCDHEETQKLLRGNATVMFHGGGNWGDIWPEHHRKRIHDVGKFSLQPDMNIITMPNSLKFYKQDGRQRDEKLVADIVDAKHPTSRITFLFRQRDSYETAKLMYPGVDVRLVPDLAFLLGPLIRVGSEKFKYDIVFLARRDKEGGNDLKKRLQAVHDGMAKLAPHLKYFVGDWADNPTDKTLLYKHRVPEANVPSMRHDAVVDASVRYFSTAKVIICDRLHASILALLMGVPHVVVDGGLDSAAYGKRVMTRAAAFETSEHCTQSSLRYREASSLSEGITEGLALLDEFFGEEQAAVP